MIELPSSVRYVKHRTIRPPRRQDRRSPDHASAPAALAIAPDLNSDGTSVATDSKRHATLLTNGALSLVSLGRSYVRLKRHAPVTLRFLRPTAALAAGGRPSWCPGWRCVGDEPKRRLSGPEGPAEAVHGVWSDPPGRRRARARQRPRAGVRAGRLDRVKRLVTTRWLGSPLVPRPVAGMPMPGNADGRSRRLGGHRRVPDHRGC